MDTQYALRFYRIHLGNIAQIYSICVLFSWAYSIQVSARYFSLVGLQRNIEIEKQSLLCRGCGLQFTFFFDRIRKEMMGKFFYISVPVYHLLCIRACSLDFINLCLFLRFHKSVPVPQISYICACPSDFMYQCLFLRFLYS